MPATAFKSLILVALVVCSALSTPTPPPSPASAMEARGSLRVHEAAAGQQAHIAGLASVIAPEHRPGDAAGERPAVDLVIVADGSGSMAGEKMELLHQTLKFLLTQLRADDRVGIVSFSDRATAHTDGLVPASQLAVLRRAVRQIAPDASTNVWSGVEAAIRMLSRRTEKNAVCSVLVMTDGQNNVDNELLEQSIPRMRKLLPEGCTLSTFGYGRDHDASMCSRLAESGRGSFTFIEKNADIGPAFSLALGGLLSVYAQNVVVDIKPEPGVAIESLRTSYQHSISDKTGAAVVEVPDMFFGERKDIAVTFAVPAVEPGREGPIATMTVTYVIPDSTEAHVATAQFTLRRPEVVTDEEVDRNVDVHTARYDVLDTMKAVIKLANEGHYDEARQMIERQIKALAGYVHDKLVQALVVELEELKGRIAPRDWEAGGHAAVLNNIRQHGYQRAMSGSFASTLLYAQEAARNAVHNYEKYQNEKNQKQSSLEL
eukprot:m51a1_g2715 putative von Willebrand factor (488) ;mRNA; f:836218-837681